MDVLRVEIVNPAESRTQTETFRTGKFVGVVLRGGGVHGWASQPADTTGLPPTLFCYSTPEASVATGGAAGTLQQLARTLVGARSANDAHGACFHAAHWDQLEQLADGRGEPPIARTLEEVMAACPGARWSAVGRAFGGGPWRATLRFDALVRMTLAWPARTWSTQISVDEMWGARTHVLSPRTSADLVGFEYRADGSARYVRLTTKDTPAGSTFSAYLR